MCARGGKEIFYMDRGCLAKKGGPVFGSGDIHKFVNGSGDPAGYTPLFLSHWFRGPDYIATFRE